MVFGEILSYCRVDIDKRNSMVWGRYGMGAVWYQGSMVWVKILWSQMANLQGAICTSAKSAIDAISGKTLGNRSAQNAPKLQWSHVLCRQENAKMLKIHKIRMQL